MTKSVQLIIFHMVPNFCAYLYELLFFIENWFFFLNVLNIEHFEWFLAHLVQIVMWNIATTWRLSSSSVKFYILILWANWNKFGRNAHLMVLFSLFTPIHNRQKRPKGATYGVSIYMYMGIQCMLFIVHLLFFLMNSIK